jgi:hypothetical protein
LLIAAAALLLAAVPALADSSSFSETQSPDDQLFHIDVAVSAANIGTIKVSLPGAGARFDPAQPIDQPGYSCSVTLSKYGEPDTGFTCSTSGDRAGAVTVHLLSQNCYAPPPEGSAQPAVADVWAAPSDPGTKPDATFELNGDPGCEAAEDTPVDVVVGAKCVVPKLKKLTLKKATQKLKKAGCKRGKVTKAFSNTVKKGRVIKQAPKPRKKLKLNSKVKLTVSKGKKP